MRPDGAPGLPFAAIAQGLLAIAPTFVAGLLPGGRRSGEEYVVRNPTRADKSAGSFQINLRSGKWIDFATGGSYGSADKGGDLVALYAYVHGCSQGEAARDCARIVGLDLSGPAPAWRRPPPPEVEGLVKIDDKVEKAIRYARMIWHDPANRPAAGSLVETYLRGRGLTVPPPPTLKYGELRHPTTPGARHPGMVARMQDDSRFCGVHRTFLDSQGRKARLDPVKMMLGQAKGATVRLSALSPCLIMAEGIESALAALQLAPGWTVWAALSAGNLAEVAIPPEVRQLVILADADQKFDGRTRAIRRVGLQAAQAACDALQGCGVRTAIIHLPDGMDGNDLLVKAPDQARQLAALLAGRLQASEAAA